MLVREISSRSTAVQLLRHPFLRIAKPPSAIIPVLFEVEQKQRLVLSNGQSAIS